jgi:hypothetical protein
VDFGLPLQLDYFGILVLTNTGIERPGLTSRLQVFSQLPGLKDGLDLSHEGRDLRTELSVVLSRFEEGQELFPDQIVKGILSAELSLNPASRSALFFPDFAELHDPPSQMLLAVVENGFGFLLVHETKGEMGGHVTDSKRKQRL